MLKSLTADLLITGLSLLGAAALPRHMRQRIPLGFAGLAKRYPAGTLIGLAGLVVALRLCCLPALPLPLPAIPDELSNLFLAQTFAAGRVANPAHPMWRHFEALFILQQPVCASVYPPVQGLLLASGWIAFGQPWAGVLGSVALMCVTVVWMLRAYVTRTWALYGGVLAGAGYGVFTYWANSYWGGAAAAIGGALVFGALVRMLSSRRLRDAAIFGLGLVILANSRPYEGFLAALPAVAILTGHFLQPSVRHETALRGQALVLASVLLCGASLTGWYNWRITGSPFRLPHTTYIQQYAAAPAFVWQGPRMTPEYRDRALRDAHVSFGVDYAEYRTLSGSARKTFQKVAAMATFYWGPLWALALVALPDFIREKRFRILVLSLGFCVTGILLTIGFQLHYAGPCSSIFVLILVDACRRFCRQWKNSGAVLVIALPVAWIGVEAWNTPFTPPSNYMTARHSIEAKLATEPGRHVVIVRYGPSHALGEEWVYNDPTIDQSSIIWARDLGPQLNHELEEYYAGRKFWLVEVDRSPVQLAACAQECGVSGDGVSRSGASTAGPRYQLP